MTTDFRALSYGERYDLAENPNTPVETLQILATDENRGVRCGVALNPSTPVETLQILSTDKYWGVRYNVALNPNTPAEILSCLATDKDTLVRAHVARNPNTPRRHYPMTNQPLPKPPMNLYILNDVLSDYHNSGLCVIAAESLIQCEQLFMEEFGAKPGSSAYVDRINVEIKKDFDAAEVIVIEGVNHPVGVVSYVHGGG